MRYEPVYLQLRAIHSEWSCFITNDRAQLNTLHTANAFNSKNTRVEFFEDLRTRLMI